MAATEHSTLAEIKKMALEDRLAAMGEIWDSIAANPAALPVTSEEAEFLEQEYQAYLRDPDQGRPLEDVITDLRTKLGDV